MAQTLNKSFRIFGGGESLRGRGLQIWARAFVRTNAAHGPFAVRRSARIVSDGGVPNDHSLDGTTHFYYAGWNLCDEYQVISTGSGLAEAPWFRYVWGPRHADELGCSDKRRYSTTLAQLNDGVAGGGTFSEGMSEAREY